MKDDVRRIQNKLHKLGFNTGDVDGVWGPKTAAAAKNYLDMAADDEIVSAAVGDPPKPWWRSRTHVALIATIIASGAAFFGFDIDAQSLTETLLAVGTMIAGLIGLWGNAKRKSRIDNDLVASGLRFSRLRRRLFG